MLGHDWCTKRPVGKIALVGETYADVREVMVDGESGLLAIHDRRERPKFVSSRRRLEWENGATAQLFSSEDPDGLRGPQFEAAWADELAKWKHADATWDTLQLGLRLGNWPRQVVTTTPKPLPLLKRLMNDPKTEVSRMKTGDNTDNLAPGFLEHVTQLYGGTSLGRQELDGELIENREDGLWSRQTLERCRVGGPPPLRRVVVAVDPPVTGHARSDACGLVAVGEGEDGKAYVLEDRTLNAVSPARWAAAATALYMRVGADLMVIETNQGGDMAESVLRAVEPNLAIRQVKASRGKWLRAEPVAHLYERGQVHHVGPLPELEDEMCDFGLDGLSWGRSPDRLDALVWGLTELMLNNSGAPRARTL